MSASNYAGFRALPELEAALISRARVHDEPLGSIARRELEQHFFALRASLGEVTLTEGEASLIVDALNGILMEPYTMGLLWAQIADAVEMNGDDRKWQVDGPALVEKLRGLTYCQALAVVDAARRWWNLEGEARTIPEGLRAVGLVR